MTRASRLFVKPCCCEPQPIRTKCEPTISTCFMTDVRRRHRFFRFILGQIPQLEDCWGAGYRSRIDFCEQPVALGAESDKGGVTQIGWFCALDRFRHTPQHGDALGVGRVIAKGRRQFTGDPLAVIAET